MPSRTANLDAPLDTCRWCSEKDIKLINWPPKYSSDQHTKDVWMPTLSAAAKAIEKFCLLSCGPKLSNGTRSGRYEWKSAQNASPGREKFHLGQFIKTTQLSSGSHHRSRMNWNWWSPHSDSRSICSDTTSEARSFSSLHSRPVSSADPFVRLKKVGYMNKNST